MALNIDIAPTILSLAGLEIPEVMQGLDLVPLINGEDQQWREDFLYEHLFDHQRIPKSEGVVAKRFKYMRYIDQDPVYEELYDIANDPYEEKNLAGDEDHINVLNDLRHRCDELRELYK
jgi:arylsulfatase A-like enzyme